MTISVEEQSTVGFKKQAVSKPFASDLIVIWILSIEDGEK
tara:strand:+ start:861 stop:980 length:120 start_codon:yes stop_codon:yes gene_type:complete